MIIVIEGQQFTFEDNAEVKVESSGYDLYIQEIGFDSSTEDKKFHFTSKRVELPTEISYMVARTYLLPCTKIYEDANGKKRMYTYFD
ncbi:MAG: hypothetical protein KA028_00830 [Candidatus Pacebacteria bacterium]|nr:hypothetical protein [Candidatus Paceibacterota bacterium]MBP9852061.1 hypothetical protein [Candidatus Paceibacterota bacterium]